jgi:glycosyltransferase involved in cell wall biosynthesis
MTKQRAMFTFLMCVNRRSPFLESALQSVFRQSDPDFRFVVVANRCGEDLWDYLQTVVDDRLSLHRTNIGQLAFNLNYGLNLVECGYVLRMDDDDVCQPDRLRTTKRCLDEYNYPDVLGGAARLIDENGQHVGVWEPPTSNKAIRNALWRTCPIIHPTAAISVPSVLKLGDYDLWIRAARVPVFQFRNTRDTLIDYRIHRDQVTGIPLSYAEIAGHMLRDSLVHGGLRSWGGALLAASKRYVRSRR